MEQTITDMSGQIIDIARKGNKKKKNKKKNTKKVPKMKNIVLLKHVLPQKKYKKHSDNMDISKKHKKNCLSKLLKKWKTETKSRGRILK